MTSSASDASLEDIPVSQIERNPENPRLVFREAELQELLESIRRYRVQVPVSVYRDKGKYFLIDGERRWKCATKLNLKTIPALIQPKPEPLDNLLMMFNIHALREQWNLLTIALKLPTIISLVEAELGRAPRIPELAERTGLPATTIRRSRLLMELPPRYRDLILEELKKPDNKQRFTEDFFIEMEKALKTVERAMPDVIPDKEHVRRVLLRKYKNETIDNLVKFRLVGKIARAEKVGVDVKTARRALQKLFEQNDFSIDAAFESSVGEAYKERDIGTRIETLLHLLEDIALDTLEDDVREKLERLRRRLTRLLQAS